MNLQTQEISHPAEATAVDKRNPHPVSFHSFDVAKVDAFVARESKRRNRTVTRSASLFRLPSGKVFIQHVAVSHPALKPVDVVVARADRPFYSDEDVRAWQNKRARS